MNRNRAFLLAAVIGDGCLTSRPSIGDYTIEFDQDNLEWLQTIAEKFEIEFGKRPKLSKTKRGFFRLRLHSKKIFNEMTKMKKHFKKIKNEKKETKANFLRGIYDSEGSVQNRRLTLSNKNEELLILCKKLLKEFGIKTGKIWKMKWGVKVLPIYGKEMLIRFRNNVNFLHPSKKEKLECLFGPP